MANVLAQDPHTVFTVLGKIEFVQLTTPQLHEVVVQRLLAETDLLRSSYEVVLDKDPVDFYTIVESTPQGDLVYDILDCPLLYPRPPRLNSSSPLDFEDGRG